MLTIDDYRENIRKKYKNDPGNPNYGLSVDPMPGDFKSRALELLHEDLIHSDKQILFAFFGITDAARARLQIEQFKNSDYRPIQSLFVDDLKKSKNEKMLNFAALIVDFEPRPFSKFRKAGAVEKPDQSGQLMSGKHSEETILEKPQNPENNPPGNIPPVIIISSETKAQNVAENPLSTPKTQEPPPRPNTSDANPKNPNPEKTSPPKPKTWLQKHGLKVLAVWTIAGLTWTSIEQDKAAQTACMQWQKDHYERVACESSGDASVIAYDSLQFKVRKFKANAQTQFFEAGKPKVWYLKHNNHYDFFTAPGYHPLQPEKILDPISRYIALRVVSGEIQSSE